MFRRPLIASLCVLALASLLQADEIPLSRYAAVDIETAKTSIYIGSVTMTMPRFTRRGDTYSSTYHARVFPYFFSSEKGKLSIKIPDETLRKLERGETIQFTGEGANSDGESRRIEGRVVPTDA